MPPSVTIGDTVLVNTPFRPIHDAVQHAAIVTSVRWSDDPASERIGATVFPAASQPITMIELEREDLLDRVGPLGKAASWQHKAVLE